MQRRQNPAEFEVYLWDFYDYWNFKEEFFEQDFTCPFLCADHMNENERLARGERRPRGSVDYPHSNQHVAQGFTKYRPIREAYPDVLLEEEEPCSSKLITSVVEINRELIAHLAKHPSLLRQLQPRTFEKLVAEIFRNQGFDVTLTPHTRDGGFDVIAARNNPLGEHVYLIECKRYAQNSKVGVEIVRGLYGTVMERRATKGILATTSYFTKDAVDFATPLRFQLSLRDYTAVVDWLKNETQYAGAAKGNLLVSSDTNRKASVAASRSGHLV
jgi:hypothetical protein